MEKEKNFSLRVDLESDKGIENIPRLLDLLERYNLKASFYLVMGGESNILDLIRYRGELKKSGERKIKVWALKDKIRMLFFPRNFVKKNKKILKRIIKEGHELGIHGWKHRCWARGFDKIDTKKQIDKAIKEYKRIFGVNPISWSSPGFNNNEKVLKELEEREIKFVSDFSGEKIKIYGGIKNVPITIKGENNMPFIEYLEERGDSDEKGLKIFKDEIENKDIVSFYIHGLYEARFRLNLLDMIFRFINKKKIKNKRIIDY